MVQQPTHRTIQGTANTTMLEELSRSLIGEIKEPCWEDLLQENLFSQGITSISIKDISQLMPCSHRLERLDQSIYNSPGNLDSV